MKLPRIASAVALAAALLLGTCLTATPAHAASDSAILRLKGPGSAYTQAAFMGRTGTPGSTLTHTIQVVNTGSTTSQFQVTAESSDTGFALFKGSTLLSQSELQGNYQRTEPYFTVRLAPGAAETLLVKAPMQYASGRTLVTVRVRNAVTDTYIDDAFLYFAESDPTSGYGWDEHVTANSQKPVGGIWDEQPVFANPVAPAGGAAVFTVTVKNQSQTPFNAYFLLTVDTGSTGWQTTVKLGTTDVTAEAFSGTSFLLAPGKTRIYKVRIKASNPTDDLFALKSWTGDGDSFTGWSNAFLIATTAG